MAIAALSFEPKIWGKERLELSSSCKNAEDWKKLWKKPKNSNLFKLGPCWKQMTTYQVKDFEAEVGFFIDGLGLTVNALGADFAMFTNPEKEFYFSVKPVGKNQKPTPPDTFALEFMIEDIQSVSKKLEKRGVQFSRKPEPFGPDKKCKSGLFNGTFETPNGVQISLWGMVEEKKDNKTRRR